LVNILQFSTIAVISWPDIPLKKTTGQLVVDDEDSGGGGVEVGGEERRVSMACDKVMEVLSDIEGGQIATCRLPGSI